MAELTGFLAELASGKYTVTDEEWVVILQGVLAHTLNDLSKSLEYTIGTLLLCASIAWGAYQLLIPMSLAAGFMLLLVGMVFLVTLVVCLALLYNAGLVPVVASKARHEHIVDYFKAKKAYELARSKHRTRKK